MIILVAHVDEAESVGGDTTRIIEAAVGGALGAKGSQKSAGRIEHLDSVVVEVRDDVLADPVHGHPAEAVELAFATAQRSKLLHEVPIIVEYLRPRRCKVVYIDRALILKSARGAERSQ